MKLVSYISTKERLERFESFFNNKDFWADKYDIDDIVDIVKFVRTTSTMRDTAYLIIDIETQPLKFSNDSIVAAMERLASFTTARPIFILGRTESENRLAGLLAEKNINNFIYPDDKLEPEIFLELEECVSENGKGFTDTTLSALQNGLQQQAIDNTQVKLKLKAGQVVQIALTGARHSVGTTTQCLAISDYLTKVGLSPLIITTDTDFYEKIKLCFDLKENLLNVIEIKGKNIAEKPPTAFDKFNVIIYDFGVIDENNFDAWSKADISILVSTGRTWELASLIRADGIISKTKKYELWLNFCTGTEYAAIKEWDKLAQAHKVRLPYQENPFKLDELVFYHSNLLSSLKKVAGYDNT